GEAMSLPATESQEHPQPGRSEISSTIRGRSGPAAENETFQFGGFRLLRRQRKLLVDGTKIELGSRAFDLLLVLLEADGSLVTKDELLRRVWPGIIVTEANLKVQVSALRKALGDGRDFIRTECGRGYRFTALIRSIVARDGCHRANRQPERPYR